MIRFREPSSEIIPEFPDYYFIEPYPRLREIRRHLFTILNSVEKYNRFAGTHDDDFDGSDRDPLKGLVVSMSDLTTSSDSTAEPTIQHIFVGFTWLSEAPFISRTVKTREDVRTADKRLMRMIYKIGNRILNADVLIPEREGSQNSSYLNFNPLSYDYYHSDKPGFYQSNMKNIEKYFIAIRYIMENPEIPWRLQRILSLTLIYDFMAFCAQTLRDAVMMQANLAQTRANLQFTLKTYQANAEFVDQLLFHNAFHAIIDVIKPAPPPPQSYVQRSSPKRTSFSRMTAENRMELLSETTDHTQDDAEDADDDEDDESEYSDDESSGDETMTPPTISSAHRRRCEADLRKLNHPYVMGNKRSLWASIQTDLQPPRRKRIARTIHREDDETPGTSSSKQSVPSSPMSPFHIEDPPPAAQEYSTPSGQIEMSIKEEAPAPLTLTQPPPLGDVEQPSMQEIMHPSMIETSSSAPTLGLMTPPAKSPSRDSVSAIRRAKARAAADKARLNLLTVNNNDKKFMSLKKASHKIIIDSGASTCGTGLRNTLRDLKPTSCSVSAAFGESAQPTEMGLLPPFMLKTVVIEQMNDTTLLSVSQACAQGFVGIFTSKVCKFYNAKDVIPHLQDISQKANPVMSGKVEDGLYLLDSN